MSISTLSQDHPSLTLDEIELTTGVRIEYAEAGAAGAQPVLFLHGYSDSWFSWSEILARLPETLHGYAPSLRGHGGSDRPARGYDFADFVADAVAILDDLGIDRTIVVGHSMGSLIAQQLTLDYPERVQGLVLVASATAANNETVVELAGVVETLADAVPEAFAREFQMSTIHELVPTAFLDKVVAESLKLPARVWREAMKGMQAADNSARLSSIEAPTLILWGDRDTVFLRDEQEQLVGSIPGAKLEIYADTGHALHWEQPERFLRALEAFARP